MIRILLKILVSIYFLTPLLGIGQDIYKTEIIKVSDGLPSDYVNCTIKKDGNLYIATQRGLCLYDGYNFVKSKKITTSTTYLFNKKNKLFLYSRSLGLSSINSIFENPLIIAQVDFKDSIPNNDHFNNIYVDHENRVWCTDENKLKYFGLNFQESKSYTIENQIPDLDQKASYFEPNNNQVWIFTQKGVYVWDKKTNGLKRHQNLDLADSYVSAFLADPEIMYCTTINGTLLSYNLRTNTISKIFSFENLNSKLSIVKDAILQKENLILFSNNELFSFDLKTLKKNVLFSTKNKINHVLFDKETNIIWISTNNGLVKLVKKNEGILNLNLPIDNTKEVNDIKEDQEGNLWILNKTNQIFCYSKLKKWTIYTIPDLNVVCNALNIQNGVVVIAGNTGIYKIEHNSIKKIIATQTNIKKAILDNKNQLWVMPDKGIIRIYDFSTLKEKNNYVKNTSTYWKENTFNDIILNKDGKIWTASWMPKGFGISYFDDEINSFVEISALKQFKNEPLFVTDYYNRIGFSSNNNLLFSGYGGWNMVNSQGKIIHWLNTEQYQLANDQVEGITSDSDGNIWFACGEGLNRYNFKRDKVIQIAQIDGLSSSNLTNAFCKLNGGKLAVASNFGIQIIDLKKIIKTQLINKLALTLIKKDGTIIPFKKNEITLDYDFTELDLYFSALSFSDKEKIIYRYKFDDEKTWNYLGSNPKLALIKLSSGNYKLTVQAGDNLGNWQKKTLQTTIKISPPFYRTVWFLSLLALLFILIGYSINRYLVNQEKIKGVLKRKIKDGEMQTLRSQMNPHFLFNSLNSINSFIIQQKSEEASGYLTTFSKLMRNILDNSRHETISLEKEIETLKLYLKLEAARLENKFDYQIIFKKSIETDHTLIPPLVLQPFVENAIWHGLHNKPEKGSLTISIDYQNEEKTVVLITDDGIGRAASALLKKEEIKHKSYGIEITINRLTLINSKNKVTIKDLFDKQNNAAGTQVELEIYHHD